MIQNFLTEIMNQSPWLGWLAVFVLTFLHELGWIAYIRGIAHKHLMWAVVGNTWIIFSGILTTCMVLQNLSTIAAAVCGGILGILVLWPKLTKEE